MAIATTPPPSSSTPVLNENASMKLGNSYLLPADALPSNAADHQKQKLDYRDVLYTSFILSLHILCLFAPSTFSWDAFVVAYILYLLTGVFGVTMSYHRNLSHRSFKLPKYLEYMFAYFGLLAFQGDPIFWVSTHRHHHKVTDTERDPHSPIESFMFAHIFWLFDHKKRDRKGVNRKSVGDLTRQPYYIFLEKTVVFHAYLLAGLLYLLGGFPYIVWGMGVRTVWGLHITFLVNSVCHTWGCQRWKTGDLSRNNWLIAIVTFGEGWHNNHHAFEYSARQGIDWWEIDMTYYAIKTLEYFGLATDVKVPSKLHMEKMAIKEDTKLSSSELREKFA